MSDNLEPLSPRDAAQLVVEGRVNKEKFGLAAEQERAGYRNMKVADPVRAEDYEIAGDQLAEALRQDGTPPAEPLEVGYREHDTGKPKPAEEIVSIDQASHDLSRWRESMGDQIEAAETKQIADAIDALRGDSQPQAPAEPVALDQPIQTAAPEQPVQPQAPQVQQQAAQPDDEVVKLLQSNPKLLDAVIGSIMLLLLGPAAKLPKLSDQQYNYCCWASPDSMGLAAFPRRL